MSSGAVRRRSTPQPTRPIMHSFDGSSASRSSGNEGPLMLDRIQGRARVARPWENPHASDHEILGVKPHASPQAIRRAYLDLVRIWHPDRFPNASTFRHDAELATKRIRIVGYTEASGVYQARVGRGGFD